MLFWWNALDPMAGQAHREELEKIALEDAVNSTDALKKSLQDTNCRDAKHGNYRLAILTYNMYILCELCVYKIV